MSAQLMTPPEQTASGSVQAPSHVVMVRPHRFSVNASTAGDNAFQQPGVPDGARAARGAYDDTTRLAEALRDEGVAVSLYEDTSAETPDSVFPNNWFTTHPDGRILLCPMYAPNRRRERRHDVIEQLQQNCGATEVLDWTAAEDYGQFLEGTGAVVIDHEQQVAYGCRSQRLTAGLFTRFCREFGLTPVLFDALDSSGRSVYHTNVMMSVGETVAVVGSSLIPDPVERENVLERLRASGRLVVELTEDQIRAFAANVMQLRGDHGPVVAMSTTAEAALRADQREAILSRSRILSVDVSTVEASGGSVRCMLAGIHLPAA